MLRTLDHRLLNSRRLLLRCSYTLVHRCCTFPHHHNLIKPRTARSSPCPCPCSVPAAKILNPPPVVVVAISNALRSVVVKPLLQPMSDSAIAGHMSNLMKQQKPPALPSHLLRVGGPFSARASLLLPLLQKPTMPLPRFPAAAAAAAGSSLYNNYYITNFNFNAAAAATAIRQFSTSPSSTEPVPQGSTQPYFPAVNQGGGGVPVVFGSSSEASYGDVMGDMESQMSMNTQKPDEKKIRSYELRIHAILALVFFYFFLRSVAAVDIQTFPPTNRKMIVYEPGEEDKGFQKRITGRETLPSTDHYSCKMRSMLEGILSNMDKVIK